MKKIEPRGKVLFSDTFINLRNWHLEGAVKGVTIVRPGAMRLDCSGSRQGGQGCMAFSKLDFPDNICIEYDLVMEQQNGLIITFIGMKGVKGADAITGVPKRKGIFKEYVGKKASTRSYHVSVSRYDDKGKHTGVSNWRRNPGLNLMGSGKDPCKKAGTTYHVAIIKKGPLLQLQVDGKVASGFRDPGKLPGPIPTVGKIGFRTIGSRAIARISNFKVTALE